MKRNFNNRNNYNRPRREQEKQFNGLTVEVRGGDFNKALRKFKRKVADSGILQEVKERSHYVKPSEKRRKAKQAGRKRYEKMVEKRKIELGY